MNGVRITPHNLWEGRCRNRTLHCLEIVGFTACKTRREMKKKRGFHIRRAGMVSSLIKSFAELKFSLVRMAGPGLVTQSKKLFLGKKISPWL